ncbi:MAG: hypothetical protein FK733_11230 [Asgard group archaeon]|nr:hypothetical protein [Asgard group archaeon]
MPLKKLHYVLSFLVIAGIVTLPLYYSTVTADDFVGVYGSVDALTITTDDMTLMVNDYKPSFTWWSFNQTSSDEKYNLRFSKVYEYFGTDPFLDSAIELGGINYNLLTSDWESSLVEDSYNAYLNLTLSGLANNVEIQFIIHVSAFHRSVNNTDYLVKPFIEAKINIVIKNWIFSPGAQGVAFKVELFESQQINDVDLKNSSSLYTNIDALDFMNYASYPAEKASFKWLEVADYYNDTVLNETDLIGTAFFNETYTPPEDEILHMWISYPKVEDNFMIAHTAILGLYDPSSEYPTGEYGVSIFALISIIFVANIGYIIYRRKK